MSLKEYRRKRKFDNTPEPAPGKRRAGRGDLRFVVQKHHASREHYDFRLEFDGALKSWAVPKGPSMTSGNPRLAVKVEDHPLEYGSFEGTIPKGNYGAGTVMVWDRGTFVERGSRGRADSERALKAGMLAGHITFVLKGEKLRGEFALVRLKKKGAPDNGWLLIKKHDSEASRMNVLKEDRSVATGRSMSQIAAEAESKGEVWLPAQGRQKKPAKPAPPLQPKATLRSRVRATAKEKIPRRVRPMEPVSAALPPKEGGWIYQRFGAGVRAMAEVGPLPHLYSKAFLSFDRRYPEILTALRGLKKEAVLDGEVITVGRKAEFHISDLLYAEGRDWRNQPWSARQAELKRWEWAPPLHLVISAQRAEAVKGITPPASLVAKKVESVYHSGLSRDWLRLRLSAASQTTKRPSPWLTAERPLLTHLNKRYWPKEGYTKGDLIAYYEAVASVLLPHLRDRPQSLHRQPDGIRNEGFFHKDMSSFLPRRIETVRVSSRSMGRTVNYALCQDLYSLLYLVNLGCIELNPWLSRRGSLDHPDWIVIDLDPDTNDFAEVIEVAQAVHRVLKKIGAEAFCKTSGASGIHICVPTGGKCDYDTGRQFAEALCRVVHREFPTNTSVERNPAKRRGKIYLDFLQNRRGQTLAAPYCVRPRAQATVSMPLKWTELKAGLSPDQFTIKTAPRRIARLGDLWKPLLSSSVDIDRSMKRLSKLFHI